MKKQPVYASGTMIAKKYRIDKAIARGGCSIVYRGTHTGMARTVALKIMTIDSDEDDTSWVERFKREAQLASQLQHEHTITTYDYGYDRGLWYIVMEWVEGASLRNLIKDEGALAPARAARFCAQLLQSIAEAHGMGILHRDLKPSNIMVYTNKDGEEHVKVLDFGLAKAEAHMLQGDALKLTRDGDFVGTPRYASPEQLVGRELSKASDIYGVGMVMWEMLTGEPAVPEIDYGVCVQYHLGKEPWRLPGDHIDAGLVEIVEFALNKNQAARYQSCDQMLDALNHWIANPVTPPESVLPADEPLKDPFFTQDHSPPPASPSPETARLPVIGLSSAQVEDELDYFLGDAISHAEEDAGAMPPVEVHTPGVGAEPTWSEASLEAQDADEQARPKRHQPTGPPIRRQPVTLPTRRPMLDRDAARIVFIMVTVLAAIIGVWWSNKEREHHDHQREVRAQQHDAFIDALLSKKKGAPSTLPPLLPLEESIPAEKKRAREAKMVGAAERTKSVRQLKLSLQDAGWTGVFRLKEETVAGATQSSARLRREGLSADVTFYMCEDAELAQALYDRDDEGVQRARFGLTVVQYTSKGELSAQSMLAFSQALRKIGPDAISAPR